MRLLKKFLEQELNISDEKVITQFKQYETLLLEWNKKINLVSRQTNSIENHILNSIFFLSKYPLKGSEKVIDIGTGGGFPGIPLKILYPGLEVTLLDSIQKKVKVLADIIQKMGLTNINAVCGRAEQLSENGVYKRRLDIVTAKAVAPLLDLYKWSRGFLKPGGRMLFIKGGDIAKETDNLLENNKIKLRVLDFNFPSGYNIEDKKLVIINT